MELVLIAAGLVGVALLVVPRLLRARAGRATAQPVAWAGGSARSRRAVAPVPVAAVPAGAAPSARDDEELWDDGLEWSAAPVSAPAPVAPSAPADADGFDDDLDDLAPWSPRRAERAAEPPV
ncbi:MAG TPA: hypothetical protein VF533_09195, partial [Solirubrobacteraceae bacterium]